MAMNRAEIRAQVQIYRRDLVPVFHTETEYNAAINAAIRSYPKALRLPEVDTSVTTVDETRRYALSLSGLSEVEQVRRVWLEGSDDHFYPLGRWFVEDDGGTLTLVLDEDPPDESLTIQIEYLKDHAEFSAEDVDFTGDEWWIIYKATTLLLAQSDPRDEEPAMVQADLARFDALRAAREAELLGKRGRVARKVRTQVWP